MKRIVVKYAAVTAIGCALLGSQGCGMKWVQSGGDSQSGGFRRREPRISKTFGRWIGK